MKIEEIRINGIRGFNYVKDENGDPSPHVIKLNGKHLFLYGENGTGKSSLFDAIEWCLTGEIKEASKRKIQNQKDFLINKFSEDQDNPYVEISFAEGHNPFLRSVNDRKRSFDHVDEADACLIESNRIEQFVIDNKKTLWQRFSDLLGFEELITFDEQLKRLKNESLRQYNSTKTEFKSKEGTVDRIKKEIVELESIFNSEFGVDWKNPFNYQDDKDENKRYINLEKIIDRFNNYQEKYLRYVEVTEEKYKNQSLLKEKRQMSPTSGISKIVNEAHKYLSSIDKLDKCPVCDQKIEFIKVCERLERLNNSLAEITGIESNLTKNIKEIDTYESFLNSLTNEIKNLAQDLYVEEFDKEPTFKDLFIYTRDKTAFSEEECSKLKKKIDMRRKIGMYQEKINNLSEQESSLYECEHELRLKELIYKDIEKFYDKYSELYTEKIRTELSLISENQVTHIYKALNQSNHEPVEELIIEPDLSKKDITFSVKIKNESEMIEATEFLSTGHLRCLGFACLIARIKEKLNNIEFLIIDDPIYSIDHEHRYNLIQYLMELGREYQLIITSSDRLFFDIMRNNFDGNKFVSYKTCVSHDSGIITLNVKIKKQKQYIDEAKKYLELNDYRAASLYARLSLETKLFDIAKELKLEIPINRMDKITIKEIMGAELQKKLIKKYAPDNPTKEREIDTEFSELRNHRYFKSLLNGFPLDHEVHHPHEDRIFYSKNEVETAIDSINRFNRFIDSLKSERSPPSP